MKALTEFFATGFYSGLLPKAPGTWGSLLAAMSAPVFTLTGSSIWVFSILGLLFLIIGIPVSSAYEKQTGVTDPSEVVIDEIAGQFLAFILVPVTPFTLILGFILFRIFDIFKPFPANYAQNNMPGGWGIMLDDIVAGIYAGVLNYYSYIFILT